MEGDGHRLRHPVTEADWRRGPADAPITLVEYIDFQCPCCQGSYPVIERLLAEYGDHVRFVVREFPIGGTHPLAEGAARAAEAAGLQGKFWEMYRRMIESQEHLHLKELDNYARELGLDMNQFHRDMKSAELAEKIKREKYHGMRSGVNGTPTIYINNIRFDGAACPVQEEELREALAKVHLPQATLE